MLHLHRCLKEDGIFMEPFPLVLAAVAAALSLSACATVNAGPSTPGMAERMIVRGSLTYRERIALPPGSVAEVTLQDVSRRSEEHTSELQSLMRISYAVFCLKKNNKQLKK